jgi:hypothetical protein
MQQRFTTGGGYAYMASSGISSMNCEHEDVLQGPAGWGWKLLCMRNESFC